MYTQTAARIENWGKSLGIEVKATDYICHLHFKDEHIKMYDEIKIGNAINQLYFRKKVLKEDALPTIEHQFNSKLQQRHQRCIIIEPQEQEPHHSDDEEENIEGQQQILVEQQDFIDFIDLQEPTLSKPVYNFTEQEETPLILEPIDHFKKNINKVSILPPYWFFFEKSRTLEFMRIDPTSKRIKNHIRLNEDLSVTAICSNNDEISLEAKIASTKKVYEYLKSVEKWPICVGTQIERRLFSKECKGVIIGADKYKRFQMNPRCKSCRVLRNQLQTRDALCNKLEKSNKRGGQNIASQCKRSKC